MAMSFLKPATMSKYSFLARVEVCFSRLGYTAQPRIPAAGPNHLPLAVIFEELKLPMGPYVTAKAFGKARLRELQTN